MSEAQKAYFKYRKSQIKQGKIPEEPRAPSPELHPPRNALREAHERCNAAAAKESTAGTPCKPPPMTWEEFHQIPVKPIPPNLTGKEPPRPIKDLRTLWTDQKEQESTTDTTTPDPKLPTYVGIDLGYNLHKKPSAPPPKVPPKPPPLHALIDNFATSPTETMSPDNSPEQHDLTDHDLTPEETEWIYKMTIYKQPPHPDMAQKEPSIEWTGIDPQNANAIAPGKTFNAIGRAKLTTQGTSNGTTESTFHRSIGKCLTK